MFNHSFYTLKLGREESALLQYLLDEIGSSDKHRD